MKYIVFVVCLLLSSFVLLDGAQARRAVLASSSAKASASSSASTNSECSDITPPPGTYTCAQQKKFGKCDACWMTKGSFCKKTCGLCGVTDTTKLPCFEDLAPQAEEDCNVEIQYADTESEAKARAKRCGFALAGATKGGKATAQTEGGQVASVASGQGSTATSSSSPGQASASATATGGGSASASAKD